jgi:AbrB family looped-hinge helix DNA binding protein
MKPLPCPFPFKWVKFSTKGQITVPKALRKRLKLKEGSECLVSTRPSCGGTEIVLTPVGKAPSRNHVLEYIVEGGETIGFMWRYVAPKKPLDGMGETPHIDHAQ